MPSIPVKLGDPIILTLTLWDGASGLYPQAHVYDSADVEVAGSPFDLSEVGTTGRYTSIAFTPTALDTFTALFITYTDAPHTLESATHGRAEESYPVELAQTAASGASINTPANASSTLTTGGTVSGDYSETVELDDTYWQIDDDAGEIDMYFEFLISADGAPVSATMTGRVQGLNDSLGVYAWNWGVGWEQIGTLDGQGSPADIPHTFNLFAQHVGTGADLGKVRIRFQNTGLTTANFYVDQIFLSYAVINRSVGYANGAIWIDTVNGTAGTVSFINGTADNPVNSLADAMTISTALGLKRFYVAPGSSITLDEAYDNFTFYGAHWDLVLNGKSISETGIFGANVSGTATAAGGAPHFHDCFMGTVTLPACHFHDCALEADVTLADAGSYFWDQCFSGIAGTATPSVDFGAGVGATQLNMRHYSGGIEVENIGQTGTDNMSLEGWGQLIMNANCAGGTIAMRGHFRVTDNASGVVTLSDDASFSRLEVVKATAQGNVRTDHVYAVAEDAVRKVAVGSLDYVTFTIRAPGAADFSAPVSTITLYCWYATLGDTNPSSYREDG